MTGAWKSLFYEQPLVSTLTEVKIRIKSGGKKGSQAQFQIPWGKT